jgi:hypothetical protein
MSLISSVLCSGFALALLAPPLLILDPAHPAAGQDAEKDKDKDKDKVKDKTKPKAKSPLDGAWRLVSAKDPRSGEMKKLPEGVELFKLVVDGRFVWTYVQNNKAVGGAGGRYTVDNDTYTEITEFALAPNQVPMTGKSFNFSWKIEDGKWYHKGTLKIGNGKQEIDQIFERVP